MWKFSWEFAGRRPCHFHSEPELNLVISGTATFRIGEVTVDACKGDLIAFPPGQEHALLQTSSDVYLFAIGMDSSLSAEALRDNWAHAALPTHLRLSSGDLASLVARCSAIVDRDRVDHLAAELWEQAHWLRQRRAQGHKAPLHVFVRRALSVLSENPDWDCARVARASRAPMAELSRYFHRDLGMTFVKYRSRLRLLRLVHLMDEGGTNLTSSAITAGFGSYSQCHRVFQAVLGCSPRQFFDTGLREQMQLTYESDAASEVSSQT